MPSIIGFSILFLRSSLFFIWLPLVFFYFVKVVIFAISYALIWRCHQWCLYRISFDPVSFAFLILYLSFVFLLLSFPFTLHQPQKGEKSLLLAFQRRPVDLTFLISFLISRSLHLIPLKIEINGFSNEFSPHFPQINARIY